MAIAEQLRAALESNYRQQLLSLCRQLDNNLTLKAGGNEESLAHHVARKAYGLDCLKVLVDKFGAAILLSRQENKYGNAPLHLMAFFQSEASMEFAYSQLGPECFAVRGRYNRTLAFMAAENKRTNSCLKWLAGKSGPSCLRVTDSIGDTPVHMAAFKQGEDSMELFKLHLGADCFRQRGKLGRIAAHRAAENETGNSALKWLLVHDGPDSLMEKDDHGNTAVHLAAWKQGEDSVRMIKEQLGSLVFVLKNNNGETAVHMAAKNAKDNSALAWCIKELGPRCLLVKDSKDRMPIHLAAEHQDEKSMQLAVSALGRDCLTVPGEKQRTAAHCAATNSRSSSALLWIVGQLGAECLKLIDSEGSMALHLAAQHQGVGSLKFIRDSLGVAAFKLEGRDGQTVAHYAATSSQKRELIAWIVSEIGPQILLVRDDRGKTPAELAGYYE